ncbi:MAG: hypothetical protein GTN73_05380 [Candidatus Aminicenantes bacterium]|nr:hypothetical protein [Candidatus Aminicenantes bacterium]
MCEKKINLKFVKAILDAFFEHSNGEYLLIAKYPIGKRSKMRFKSFWKGEPKALIKAFMDTEK